MLASFTTVRVFPAETACRTPGRSVPENVATVSELIVGLISRPTLPLRPMVTSYAFAPELFGTCGGVQSAALLQFPAPPFQVEMVSAPASGTNAVTSKAEKRIEEWPICDTCLSAHSRSISLAG